MEYNRLRNVDCMKFMAAMPDKCVDFTFTDIPYGVVNATEQGRPCNITNLNKGAADIVTFDLLEFLDNIYRITKNSFLIFCSIEQCGIMSDHTRGYNGTRRYIIWEKTNPCPLHGQRLYLSGIEVALWFKYRGAKTFNAFCKNTVFRHPIGSSKMHPTEKNHALIKELIEDNTNIGDVVFDPCAGGGSILFVAKKLKRLYLGCELNKEYFVAASRRLFSQSA